jgi:hypothetical protein
MAFKAAAQPRATALALTSPTMDMAGALAWKFPPPQPLEWFEIETSAPVRDALLGRNTISEIREKQIAPVQAVQQEERETTWSAFSQRAVGSFAQLVGEFGARITDTQEVVLMPGNRPGIIVQCAVPAAKGEALVNALNQKRMLAVANWEANQQIVGGMGIASGRRADMDQAAPQAAGQNAMLTQRQFLARNAERNQLPVRRMNEDDLASNQVSPYSNFYVQTPPPEQRVAIENRASNMQRYAFAPGQMPAPTGGGISQSRRLASQPAPTQSYGNLGQTRGTTLPERQAANFAASNIAGAPTTGNLRLPGTPGTQYGGANIPEQEMQVYFVLEPDRLPVLINAPAQAKQPAR